MFRKLRAVSRRRLLAGLVALLAAVAATPVVIREVLAVPAPHHIWYYSSSSYTSLVGEGQWNCNGTYSQWWGSTSLYKKTKSISCSPIEPIDPVEPLR